MTCWRSECRTGCYYPDVCSEKQEEPMTAAEQAAEDRAHELAEERKWWREHGGTKGDSDRDADRYERYLDDLGPTT